MVFCEWNTRVQRHQKLREKMETKHLDVGTLFFLKNNSIKDDIISWPLLFFSVFLEILCIFFCAFLCVFLFKKSNICVPKKKPHVFLSLQKNHPRWRFPVENPRGEDSTRFVTASWDATMHVFDLTRKELDKSLDGNRNPPCFQRNPLKKVGRKISPWDVGWFWEWKRGKVGVRIGIVRWKMSI